MPDGRDFKGVWIPGRLYLTREFSPNQKFLLIEISSLTNSKNKQCYASNKHFADFIGLKENTIQKMILNLENAGYIKRSFEYKEGSKEISKRIIELTNKFYESFVNEHENEKTKGMEKSPYGHGENSMGGGGLKVGDKYNSNKYNNEENPKSSTAKALEDNIKSSFHINNGKNSTKYYLSEGDIEYTQEEIHKFLIDKIHEQMEYSEVGSNEYFENCITPIVMYFYDCYNATFLEQHPVLSNIAYRKIIDAYLNPPKVMENEDIDFDVYKRMIDKYFETDIGKRSGKTVDYHINYFMGKQVREYIFRRVMNE